MYKKLNYAIGDVASTTAIGATTLTLKAGHAITTDTGEANKFVAVFYSGTKSSPYQDTTREIVEAYRTDTNDFVIARAKENTIAKEWVENDKFMLIASSGVFDEYETELALKLPVTNPSVTGTLTIPETAATSDLDKFVVLDSGVIKYRTGAEVLSDIGGQAILGYTAENTANKKTDLTDNSNTYYPTQKAVKTAVDGKQDALTFGIANTNAVKVDDASVADNDYAKFTANGIEGVPYSTVLSDIGAMTNPMTTAGDVIYGGTDGLPTRLAKGDDGKVLTLASGIPSWEDAGTANALPLAGGTMTGGITLATGTTTVFPLKMVAGTNLTTAVAGVFEFDGTNLYFSV